MQSDSERPGDAKFKHDGRLVLPLDVNQSPPAGGPMGKRKRPSTHKREREYQKRQRELRKAERAEIKRERRAKRGDDSPVDSPDAAQAAEADEADEISPDHPID
jgi:hypothetical protein